ncbi:hypothetical protein PVNG_05359 [Plasmodium vivax North Korean]|uniref:VIR protein n=1 Tax=Plasmodium vivax North Korean TaxID=1035514 RepID=A0A0J9WEM7_PLAVI|nr:hypothetical protein PVNG_05359 [Plasmodium vivax North Korean]
MLYVILLIIFYNYPFLKLESYLKLSILNRLIKRLNDTEHEKCYKSILDHFESVDNAHKETLKNIGCNLESGYTYLTASDENTLTDLCKYLNLWLDVQKSIYVNDNFGITDEEWHNIENLWDQNEAYDPKCARKQDKHNISHIGERKKLMTYCINRNYIRGLCEPSLHSGVNISSACHAFNDFIKKHYEEFYTETKCFYKAHEPIDYRYHISNECTLYNRSKTFPFYDSHKKAILEVHNVRPTIKKCVIPPVVDGNNEHTEDDADVLQEPSEPDNALDESEDGLAESKFRHPRQEVNPDDHPVLFHLPSTDANLTENGPSKPIYYAGLSVSGVFFTSMVFKKEKLRQSTNKHLAEQWLQRTSEYMDSNSESAHYNFPYQSMQN